MSSSAEGEGNLTQPFPEPVSCVPVSNIQDPDLGEEEPQPLSKEESSSNQAPKGRKNCWRTFSQMKALIEESGDDCSSVASSAHVPEQYASQSAGSAGEGKETDLPALCKGNVGRPQVTPVRLAESINLALAYCVYVRELYEKTYDGMSSDSDGADTDTAEATGGSPKKKMKGKGKGQCGKDKGYYKDCQDDESAKSSASKTKSAQRKPSSESTESKTSVSDTGESSHSNDSEYHCGTEGDCEETESESLQDTPRLTRNIAKKIGGIEAVDRAEVVGRRRRKFFKCEFCEEKFPSREILTVHEAHHVYQSIGGESGAETPVSDLGTNASAEKSPRSEATDSLDGCSETTSDVSTNRTERKLRRSSFDKVKCETCLKVFGTRAQCDEHILLEHSSEYFECEVCAMKFPNENKLISHAQKVHLGSEDKTEKVRVSSKRRSLKVASPSRESVGDSASEPEKFRKGEVTSRRRSPRDTSPKGAKVEKSRRSGDSVRDSSSEPEAKKPRKGEVGSQRRSPRGTSLEGAKLEKSRKSGDSFHDSSSELDAKKLRKDASGEKLHSPRPPSNVVQKGSVQGESSGQAGNKEKQSVKGAEKDRQSSPMVMSPKGKGPGFVSPSALGGNAKPSGNDPKVGAPKRIVQQPKGTKCSECTWVFFCEQKLQEHVKLVHGKKKSPKTDGKSKQGSASPPKTPKKPSVEPSVSSPKTPKKPSVEPGVSSVSDKDIKKKVSPNKSKNSDGNDSHDSGEPCLIGDTSKTRSGREVKQCNLCTKTFTSEKNLKDHFSEHLRGFTCSICGIITQGENGLALHFQKEHKGCEMSFHRNVNVEALQNSDSDSELPESSRRRGRDDDSTYSYKPPAKKPVLQISSQLFSPHSKN